MFSVLKILDPLKEVYSAVLLLSSLLPGKTISTVN